VDAAATLDCACFSSTPTCIRNKATMRSLLLLFLGIPLPIIILIALFVH
jgi:hypothetical protein